MHPLVSVVVPIYNAEKYLVRCIESLRNQTLKELEIILVNDGSKDSSLAICKEYAAADSRVVLIDKVNGGVSAARNDGLRAAKGDFVGFVDPDDWVNPEMYAEMLAAIVSSQAEICVCNYLKEIDGKTEYMLMEQKGVVPKEAVVDKIVANIIAKPSFGSGETDIMGSVWRLLVKRDFLQKENIHFDEDVSFMEDLLFCVEAFLKCNCAVIHEGAFYHYEVYDASVVNSYKADFFEKQQIIFLKLMDLVKREGQLDALKQRLDNRYVIIALLSFANVVHKDNPKLLGQKLAVMDAICRDERLVGILERMDLSIIEMRKKWEIVLMKRKASRTLYGYYKLLNKAKSILKKR